MTRVPLSVLFMVAGTALADPEAGVNAISDLGRINGEALACEQMGVASQAKAMMIRHAPKTRVYGELFEQQTNDAFLMQGRNPEPCPTTDSFISRLRQLSTRLQAVLPAPASPVDW